MCSAIMSEMLTNGSENIVNENEKCKGEEKDPKSKKACEREAVETGDEAVEEGWINALFELCKGGAWVIENKLCVCVKEAERRQGEKEREEDGREGGKGGDTERRRD